MAVPWEYVGVIDFGTWGTAVAVCPFQQSFADGMQACVLNTNIGYGSERGACISSPADLASAYNNTLVSFPGGHAGALCCKQHTAVLLDSAGNLVLFGKKAVETLKNQPPP